MLDFPRWKVIFLWLITIVAAASALPSVVDVAGYRWPAGIPEPKVNLGLDLAGGSHLMLEADPAQVRTQRIEGMEESVRNKLRQMSQPVRISDISNNNGALSFLVDDPGKIDAVREAVLPLTNGAGLTGKRDWTISVVDGNRFVLAPTQEGIDQAVSQAMETAVEVVRKRIDALGTKEPTIIRSGSNRIVVQVPGLQDPQALKNLLGQTAKLEFKLVDQNANPTDVAQGIALLVGEHRDRRIELQRPQLAKIDGECFGGHDGRRSAKIKGLGWPKHNPQGRSALASTRLC